MSALANLLQQSLQLPALKAAARNHYEAYQRAVGDMSCGRTLAEHISPSVSKHKAAFNATMNKIAEIDSGCPVFRL